MPTPIGFRTIGYRRFPPREAIQRIARIGYDGVELCLEHPGLAPEQLSDRDLRELVTTARDRGVRLATVSYHGDRDPLHVRWERAVRAVELTEALGCRVLIINSPRPGPGAPDDLQAQFHEQLARQIERAEEVGVTLALEPEPELLVHDCDDMVALIERMGSDSLGVNFDVGHAAITEDDLPAAIERLGEWIVGAHFEDIPAGVHKHLVPGEGDLDLAAALEALRDIGFDGWLTIDLFDIADAPDAAARASLAYMRELVAR